MDEISHKKTVNAIENDTIFSDYQVVADILNNYVKHINNNLYTQANKKFPKKKTNGFKLNMLDPIEAAVSKCKDHLNLNTIRGNMSK